MLQEPSLGKMSDSIARRAAEILGPARRDGAKLAELPEALWPRTLDQAYAIQDEFAAWLGPVGGWKVGAEPDGSVRIAPIPAACLHAQPAAIAAPARLEVELALRIGADLPARGAPYGAAELDAAIAAAHVVIEVLGSRFAAPDAVSRLSFLADGNGNDSVVIGDEIANWRALELTRLSVALTVDGTAAAQAGPGAGREQVLALLTALANHAVQHGGGLRAGQIVITGARLGPVAVAAGRIAIGRINGAEVRVTVG